MKITQHEIYFRIFIIINVVNGFVGEHRREIRLNASSSKWRRKTKPVRWCFLRCRNVISNLSYSACIQIFTTHRLSLLVPVSSLSSTFLFKYFPCTLDWRESTWYFPFSSSSCRYFHFTKVTFSWKKGNVCRRHRCCLSFQSLLSALFGEFRNVLRHVSASASRPCLP